MDGQSKGQGRKGKDKHDNSKNGNNNGNNNGTHNKNQNNNTDQIQNVADVLQQSREALYGFHAASSTFTPGMQNTQQGQYGQPPYLQTTRQTPDQGQYTNTAFYPQNYAYGIPLNNQQNTMLQNTAHTNPVQSGQDNGIPQWAASLCQQMGNIQSTLNGHTDRWQSVENHIAEQNVKLIQLQSQVSEITQVKRTLEHTNTKVHLLQDEMHGVKSSTKDYDQTIQQYSDMCDDIVANNSDLDKRMHKIESKMNSLEQKHADTNTLLQQTNEKVTDIQWRSMRENLLFCGIAEAKNFRENGEHCEEIIQDFIKTELKIQNDIKIDRAHRLGRFAPDKPRPRPIVVKFTHYKDKEHVKHLGHAVLGTTDYWVKDQYPREMEEKRKLLYDVADEARKNPENKVRLVKDKLFINNKQYIPDNTKQQQQQQPQQHYRRTDGRYSGRYYSTNSSADDNRAATQYRRQDNMQWSRTFYNRQSTPRAAQQTSNTHSSPRANQNNEKNNPWLNKLSVPGNQTPKDGENQRPSHAGKKKAQSPLESEKTTKKQKPHVDGDRVEISDSESESDQSTILLINENITDSQLSTQMPCDNDLNPEVISSTQLDPTDDVLGGQLSTSCDQAGDSSRDITDSVPQDTGGQSDRTSRDIADDSSRDHADTSSRDCADGQNQQA